MDICHIFQFSAPRQEYTDKITRQTIIYSKSTMKALEKGVKYV